jgi:DNA repair protein RadA/Sms
VETEIESDQSSQAQEKLEVHKISNLDFAIKDRIDTGFDEADNVLGGGVVPASLILLAGNPGIGKSTLVLQVASFISKKHKVIYISGEESSQQIKLRASRLKINSDNLEVAISTDANQVVELISKSKYKLAVIDSIQTISSSKVHSVAGSVSQITNVTSLIMRSAKRAGCAVIIVGHVTKEGNLAGPKLLEHLVDVVLYLEGEKEGVYKVLRSEKNRYGSTEEIGIFEMANDGLVQAKNPSEELLSQRQKLPGSVIFPALEGSRIIFTEVQALVSPSVFGYPKRTAVGVDINRLSMLAAVAHKRAGINLSNQDIYVNIVGGLKVNEPAIDLAIILAIASSYKNKAVGDLTIFGEVGLSGEIRTVNFADKRLSEAKKLGFKKAIIPHSNNQSDYYQPKDIAEAIKLIF